MITEKQIDMLIERLIKRTDEANTKFLIKLGESIKAIKELNPSQAQQLVQILKYNGNIDEIIREISKYTNMNIADIDDIFSSYAKKDQHFYKQFYQYRDIPFIEYGQNMALIRQTEALASMVKQQMYSFTRSNVLGYSIKDELGNTQFLGLRQTYDRVLEEALLNVSQGKETFDTAMSGILEDIGGSGLKTLNYESGRSVRLDSTIRMHLQDGLRLLHNANQEIIGEEFDYDGIEISVHENPAPDHEAVQGRQFSKEEYSKLDNGDFAKDYKGNIYTLDHDDKNGYRPISTMNCYHTIFSIVLGVSKPEYTDEQLEEIIQNNEKGFEFEGKHYTLYSGQQLLRRIEAELRKNKDIQILGRASDNMELVDKAQSKITKLTQKYNDVLKVSGLKSKIERARVKNYQRIKVDKNNKK